MFFIHNYIAAIQSYSASMGSHKDDIDLRDTTYDGTVLQRQTLPLSTGTLKNGLGKLTDDQYGITDNLLGTKSGGVAGVSPWVGYNTAKPEITFHFRAMKVVKQVMVHVNNAKGMHTHLSYF